NEVDRLTQTPHLVPNRDRRCFPGHSDRSRIPSRNEVVDRAGRRFHLDRGGLRLESRRSIFGRYTTSRWYPIQNASPAILACSIGRALFSQPFSQAAKQVNKIGPG